MTTKILFLRLSATLVFALLALPLFANETKKDSVTYGWKVTGEGSVGFSQIALSNWTSGGENSYSLNGLLNLGANLITKKSVWQNSLNLGYGFQNLKESGTKKINDQLILNSQYGYKASGNWYYSARANLQTQFASGYDYSKTPRAYTSAWFAPAYLLTSLGMEYINKSKTLSVIISPATCKFTFVSSPYLSSIGAFGVTPGSHSYSEFGGSVAAKFKKENILTNVNLETSLGLFSNYKEEPKNIDVNWQVLVFMKINKFLGTTLSTQLIFDDNVSGQVQFKEILNVGLSYSF